MKRFISVLIIALLSFGYTYGRDFTVENGVISYTIGADTIAITAGFASASTGTPTIYEISGKSILSLNNSSGEWGDHSLNGTVYDNFLDWSKALVDAGWGGNVASPLSDMTFELKVSMGTYEGYSKVDKFGVSAEITTSTDPQDIWEFGGTYNYDTSDDIVSVSSSELSDAGKVVTVQGLDIDGEFVSQNITLNATDGRTRVALTTSLWRVFRMINDTDVYDSHFDGTIYCYTGTTNTGGVPVDANVRAIINDGHNQTLMALYTIPKGKVAFLYRGELGVELEGNSASLAEYAHCHYESRRYGRGFTVKKAVTCMIGGGSAVYQDKRSFPDVIPSLTDIRLRAVQVSQTMALFGTFDILLVDEGLFPDEYLQAIGQPNY